jgi:hypothetical protein
VTLNLPAPSRQAKNPLADPGDGSDDHVAVVDGGAITVLVGARVGLAPRS